MRRSKHVGLVPSSGEVNSSETCARYSCLRCAKETSAPKFGGQQLLEMLCDLMPPEIGPPLRPRVASLAGPLKMPAARCRYTCRAVRAEKWRSSETWRTGLQAERQSRAPQRARDSRAVGRLGAPLG